MTAATEQALRARIKAQGSVGLDEFMDAANTAYYATGDAIGAAGDFITAPEISQCFGELIGLWAAVTWQNIGSPAAFSLVELGPGRGTLMADALRAAGAVPGFTAAANIHLIERSDELTRRQKQALAKYAVRWSGDFAAVPAGPAIVIANEFLDALPIRQWEHDSQGWNERRVGVDGAGAFRFVLEPTDRDIPTHVPGTPGSIYEDSPAVDAVVAQLAARVARDGGAALFVDYGYDTAVAGDTFQAVHRHRYSDVLAAPGTRDLTAHVNFSAVAAAARNSGARVFGPAKQGSWLKRLGIDLRTERLARGKSEETRAAVLSGIRPRQSGDVIFLTHRDNLSPRILRRHSNTSWSFDGLPMINGPFRSENGDPSHRLSLNGTTLTASKPTFQPGHVGSLWRLRQNDGNPGLMSWEPEEENIPLNAERLSNGRVYGRTGGANKAGNTPPVHASGAVSDGSAAFTLALTSSSVSAWYSRRSEWPTVTYEQPSFASIAADTSPV